MAGLGAALTLLLYVDTDVFFTVDLGIARDVDAARPRAVVGLRPLEILVGGGILLDGGSATGSVCVLRCLKAGSGTVVVSELCNCRGVARGRYSQRACVWPWV